MNRGLLFVTGSNKPNSVDFSLTGIVVFSISGALLAAEKKLDILGFILVGAVTSIGGGTLRDVLLGEVPVSWVRDPSSISISILASVVYIGLRQFGVDESIAIPCAFFAGFGLRAAAMVYKLVLPRFGA